MRKTHSRYHDVWLQLQRKRTANGSKRKGKRLNSSEKGEWWWRSMLPFLWVCSQLDIHSIALSFSFTHAMGDGNVCVSEWVFVLCAVRFIHLSCIRFYVFIPFLFQPALKNSPSVPLSQQPVVQKLFWLHSKRYIDNRPNTQWTKPNINLKLNISSTIFYFWNLSLCHLDCVHPSFDRLFLFVHFHHHHHHQIVFFLLFI